MIGTITILYSFNNIFAFSAINLLFNLISFLENPNEIATVVLEPTYLEKPKNDFLQQVRKLTTENNAILILDEIVTGFRFDLQGGQKYFDIEGDLVCYGKGIANGFPLSIITGKTEFMKIFEKLWVSSTNNSETLSLAACYATINEMKRVTKNGSILIK